LGGATIPPKEGATSVMISTTPDAVTRVLAEPRSRRAAVRLLAGAVLGGALAVRAMPAAAGVNQTGWYFCSKCNGVYFSAAPNDVNERGRCPAGGAHKYLGGGGYIMLADYDPGFLHPSYQDGWCFCVKCHGLHYTGAPIGACPAGGKHATAPSGNYVVWVGEPFADVGQQRGWRYCGKCRGLWYAGNGTRGVCPAGGGHQPVAGGNYCLNNRNA